MLLLGLEPGSRSEVLKTDKENSRKPSRLWPGETTVAYTRCGMKSDVKAMMKPCYNHNFSSPHCFCISYLMREVFFYVYTYASKIHYL
jgi:hypothetical protein